jgi:hypothetical protein
LLRKKSVAFNEYGSNLIKYKFDPLAVIEAKFAMAQGEECTKGGTQPVCSQKMWLMRKRILDLNFLRCPAILALELELKKSLGVICLVKKRWNKKVLKLRELNQ